MPRETAAEKTARLIQTEQPIWDAGALAAGIDEVGRGPLAGPVMTCCIVMDKNRLVDGVDDSKKLTEKRREALYDLLLEGAVYARIAQLDAEEIDRVNILRATEACMEECAREAPENTVFLVDAVKGLRLPGETRVLIHGDALSYSIAAASVIAKVTRDRYMIEMDKLYPEYGFAKNKGYGSAAHIAAIRKYGLCPLHRRSFLGKICPEML